MSFMAGGSAPLLKDHNTSEQIGVVSKAWLADKKGRALVKFGNSDVAKTEFADIVDGIRSNVSVGYKVNEMVLLESSEKDGDKYRVTSWTPLECSIVSIPADATVGIGRGSETEGREFETVIIRGAGVSGESGASVAIENEAQEKLITVNEREVKQMADEQKSEKKIDIEAIKAEAVAAENTRAAEILALGKTHGFEDEAAKAITDGKSVEVFRSYVLEKLAEKGLEPVETGGDLGMSDKEAKQFSFIRLFASLVDPSSQKAREAAAFEYEVIDAYEGKSNRREIRGHLIPPDVLRQGLPDMQRDLTVGTDSAGGYSVGTDLVSFIDALRNKVMCAQAGATMLRDLVGDVAVPKLSAGATAYWLAESGAATESAQTFAQLALSPKTVGAFTDISRKLLVQSSLDVEALVRNDLATVLAIALDLAALHGTGTDNQPTGIAATSGIGSVAGGTNGLAPAWSHICELETDVAVGNADIGRLGYMTNPKVRGKLKQVFTNATYGEIPLWTGKGGQGELNGYPAYCTNQVSSALTKGSSSGVCSAIFFGNWADLVFGLWSGVDILVDPYTGSSSGTVRVTAFQDADVGVRNAASFSAMLDALTT